MMKKLLSPLLIASLLCGCATEPETDNPDFYSEYTGGQKQGDRSSLYWYTERLSTPYSAADYVSVGDYAWYQSDYRWQDGNLRELIREGRRFADSPNLVSYHIHVRFDKNGEAIYQQYRINEKVLPLSAEQLTKFKRQVLIITQQTKQQSRDGISLIQGYSNGAEFNSCTGKQHQLLLLDSTLPELMIKRFGATKNYNAFLGKISGDKVALKELLLMDGANHKCLTRPKLIQE